MACTCVVGLQWGDEAKGKIVDLLTDEHDFVVRYNGGANAGHTIVAGDKVYKLSLLPTGVLRSGVRSVIGNGLVVDPARFREEVEALRAGGLDVRDRLTISHHAHVIFPYHKEEERVAEAAVTELVGPGAAIGTTMRGIGPCYADKVGRSFAVRIGELLDPTHLARRLGAIVPYKNRLLKGLAADARVFDADELTRTYAAYGDMLRPHVADTTLLLLDGLKAGKKILFEAAQGSLLDIDHGTFPYVTSSNSSAAGIWSGSGVPAHYLTRVVGIVKAYSTRVGGGPLPTELLDATGEHIRKVGREYGVVTGRARRCGWLDAVAVRYSAGFNGVDEVALMLLDVLSGLDELKVCVAYDLDGERISHFPAGAHELARCRPVYETLPGWGQDISSARTLAELPPNARRYLDRLGEILDLPLAVVSVGPDRAQTIRLR